MTRLELDEERREELEPDLAAARGFGDELASLDLDDVDPLLVPAPAEE